MKGKPMKRFLRRRRKQYPQPKIYWSGEGEISAMAAIEALSANKPWTCETIRETLSEGRVIGRCAAWKGRIVGFAIYKLCKGGEVITLAKLAVHPKFRRRHIGRVITRDITRRNSSRTLVAHLSSLDADAASIARQFLVACDSRNGVRQKAIRIDS